uniref:Uncharacterized protein n=1 Tax=Gasterosteus aculeatus TaxID=69293 RepID=G3Q699_GASAC
MAPASSSVSFFLFSHWLFQKKNKRPSRQKNKAWISRETERRGHQRGEASFEWVRKRTREMCACCCVVRRCRKAAPPASFRPNPTSNIIDPSLQLTASSCVPPTVTPLSRGERGRSRDDCTRAPGMMACVLFDDLTVRLNCFCVCMRSVLL